MKERRLEYPVVLLAGSVATGVHAGLAPGHLHEWPPLGAAFVAAAVVAGIGVAVLAVRPAAVLPLHALGVVLAALVAGYASTRLLALPPLDPEREPLDRLGVAATTVEALGLLLALHMSISRGGTR